ncbi:hypothetical protein EDC19_1197 [Natranaerovirga hydrolytica]|uniref:Uncharacterized protein n=1 Tax=Natranaerovirga hydrolytica TaxID=680378 RepID=A0A4R1N1H1_9FIRM|nr:hypothetical protein [Natranaerovirga hydrolytica]TCK98762.1 hypothetical protein EDC19_1197 [Natranaerovirga hydrolytica]
MHKKTLLKTCILLIVLTIMVGCRNNEDQLETVEANIAIIQKDIQEYFLTLDTNVLNNTHTKINETKSLLEDINSTYLYILEGAEVIVNYKNDYKDFLETNEQLIENLQQQMNTIEERSLEYYRLLSLNYRTSVGHIFGEYEMIIEMINTYNEERLGYDQETIESFETLVTQINGLIQALQELEVDHEQDIAHQEEYTTLFESYKSVLEHLNRHADMIIEVDHAVQDLNSYE